MTLKFNLQKAGEVRGPVGNLLSPFFRVRFFRDRATFNQFSEVQQRRIARENREQVVAFQRAQQPPIFGRIPTSGAEFATSREEGIEQQRLLDEAALERYAAFLEVDQKSTETSTVTLRLTPPYEDAEDIIDDPLIRQGTLMLVEFGYAGQGSPDIISPPLLFRINDPNAEFGDDIMLVFTGSDVSSSIFDRHERKRVWRRSEYASDHLILSDLAKEVGLTPSFKGVSSEPQNSQHPVFQARENDLEQNISDWQFFRELARKNQVDFINVGKTVEFTDNSIITVSKRPVYRMIYRASLLRNNDIPLQTFKPTTSPRDLFNQRGAKSMRNIKEDRDTGEASEEVVTGDSVPNHANIGTNIRAGNKGSNTTVDTPLGPVTNRQVEGDQTGGTMSSPARDEYSSEKLGNKVIEKTILTGVMGTVEMPMVPGLLPQDQVILDGVPNYYKGVYRVTSVTHRMGGESFMTEATITRTGFFKETKGTKKSPTLSKEDTQTGENSEKPRRITERS